MSNSNCEADIPAECPRRGDCRGCLMLPSDMAGERISARLERPPPASVSLRQASDWESYAASEKREPL